MRIRQIFATLAPVPLAWQHQLAAEILGIRLTGVKFVPHKGQYQNIQSKAGSSLKRNEYFPQTEGQLDC